MATSGAVGTSFHRTDALPAISVRALKASVFLYFRKIITYVLFV